MGKKILITGGTVFVSKYIATYFASKNYEVYVLNRGNKEQVKGVNLIKADRHNLGDILRKYDFDAVLDITAYTEEDVRDLVSALGSFKDYIFISSGAVYPETSPLPFKEEQKVDENTLFGEYSVNKIKAEKYLLNNVKEAYILRPPYIYGPMQNLYREPFVFECAMKNRKFYIPKDGKMNLQFFHVEDLCKLIEEILLTHPKNHILNVGNTEAVSIEKYIELCYEAVGVPLEKVFVTDHDNQRDYFSFHEFEYYLDVSKQNKILPNQKDLLEGLKESYLWYKAHQEDVVRKRYIEFIDKNFK